MSASRAEYQRAFRATHPEYKKDGAAGNKARARALTRLGQRHSAELRSLIDEERAKEGLRPLGSTPLGRRPGGSA